jgi:tight adherence protein C
MFEWLTLTLLFLIISGLAFSFYVWLEERRQRAELRATTADEPPEDTTAVMVLGRLTPVLAQQAPIRPEKQPAVRQELREAGYYHPTALTDYQAIRAVLIFLPLLLAGVLGALARRDDIPRVVIVGGALAVVGFGLPRLYIQYRARQRAREIEHGLPVAVDLIGLCLTGGQNILSAVASVCDEVRAPYPVLADEMLIVREQARMSNLPYALQQFADRTNHPDVRNLALALSQSEQLGTDISAGLLEYVNNLRVSMRHRAEARANRASFWLLFPTILCLWLPAVLVLFAPVYQEFWRLRGEYRDATKGTPSVESIGSPGAPRFTPTAAARE